LNTQKKILSKVFVLALLITTGYGVGKSVNSDADLSLLPLSNVEALAQEVDFPWMCANTSPKECITDEYGETWY
jgi:hypothetical protein